MTKTQLSSLIKERTGCKRTVSDKLATDIIEEIKNSIFSITTKPYARILGLFTVTGKVYKPRKFSLNGNVVEKDSRFKLKIKPTKDLQDFCGM